MAAAWRRRSLRQRRCNGNCRLLLIETDVSYPSLTHRDSVASKPKPAYNTLTLEQAYDCIRDWYQENVEDIRRYRPSDLALNYAPRLIRELPPTLSNLEMRGVLNEVLSGILAWGKTGSDGNLRMESYAQAGLERSGGAFTPEERSELLKTSVLASLLDHGELAEVNASNVSKNRNPSGDSRAQTNLSEAASPAIDPASGDVGGFHAVPGEAAQQTVQQSQTDSSPSPSRPEAVTSARGGFSPTSPASAAAASVGRPPAPPTTPSNPQGNPMSHGATAAAAAPAKAPVSAPASRQSAATTAPIAISDTWAIDDSLGYQAYARTLAGLITHEKTVPPLTIGLEAPWGAGKTSVMKMVQHMLDGEAGLTEKSEAGQKNCNPESELSLWGILRSLGNRNLRKDRKEDTKKDQKEDTKNADGNLPAPQPQQAGAAAPEQQTTQPAGEPGRRPQLEAKPSEKGKRFCIDSRVTVWFDAWKYENSEQLWAGLAHCIISHVTVRMSPRERELFWLRLNARRVDLARLRREIYKFVLQKLVPQTLVWTAALMAGGIGLAFGLAKLNIALWKSFWVQLGLWMHSDFWSHPAVAGSLTGATAAAAKFFHGVYQAFRSKASDKGADLLSLVREPAYEGKMGFLYLVESDVREVLDLVATPKTPLVIFIDDLDRCLPRKVAEVVEAISLFLAGDYPNCIFVLGMEPRMVAAALHVANEPLINKMTELGFADTSAPLGWRFMEKIVQLPLVLPAPTPMGLGDYLDKLAPKEETSASLSAIPDDSLIKKYEKEFEQQTTVSAVAAKTHELSQSVPDSERRAFNEASMRAYARKFDPQDPIVRASLDTAIQVFGANPRQVKRYVNMFRFCYTLRYALRLNLPEKERDLLPSDEAITKYVVMSVQWPQATVLLSQSVEVADGESVPRNMLERLETFASGLKQDETDKHDQQWTDCLNKLNLTALKWAYSPSFRRHLCTPPSLSESAGKGLW